MASENATMFTSIAALFDCQSLRYN